MPEKIAIFGTSGFSRETLDVCVNVRYKEIVFISNQGRQTEYFGYSVVSEERILLLQEEGFVFIIGIGDNMTRKRIADRYPDLPYTNVIHPDTSFGKHQRGAVDEKTGNIVTAGVRMTNNIQMGSFGIFNLNCTIGHDCVIGDFVNIAPGANISGNVVLYEGVYIGTNACVLQGRSPDQKMTIGKYATVGAGAVVTKSVPDDVIVKGLPAKQSATHVTTNIKQEDLDDGEKTHHHRGGGGHARVLISTLKVLQREIIGILHPDLTMAGQMIEGIPVLGNDDKVLEYPPDEIELVNGIGSVSSTGKRKSIYMSFKNNGYSFLQVIHPAATISGDVRLKEGVQIMAGAVVQTGCVVGENAIVNTGAVIDHDCIIGEHAHIAPGAVLSGGINIGAMSHIGTAAIVIQGITIGEGALIGAGAVVLRDVPPGKKMVGNPAREIN